MPISRVRGIFGKCLMKKMLHFKIVENLHSHGLAVRSLAFSNRHPWLESRPGRFLCNNINLFHLYIVLIQNLGHVPVKFQTQKLN